MRKANAPRKLSPDVSRRLSDSRRQSAALTLREIHCPFCSFLVEKVMDRPGFADMIQQLEHGKAAAVFVKDCCAIMGLNQKDLENQGILA